MEQGSIPAAGGQNYKVGQLLIVVGWRLGSADQLWVVVVTARPCYVIWVVDLCIYQVLSVGQARVSTFAKQECYGFYRSKGMGLVNIKRVRFRGYQSVCHRGVALLVLQWAGGQQGGNLTD